MLKIFFIFIFLFTPTLSFSEAIGRVGNGGNVIVCLTFPVNSCFGRPGYNSAGAFYDTYEADVRYKLKPLSLREDAVPPTSNIDYAIKLLSALKQHNARLAEQLSGYVNTFAAEANFISDMQLLPIPDTGISFIPHGSELRQLVVQREPVSPLDRRYVISKDLWDLLSTADQAHAILHEIFYRHALEIRQNTQSSEYIRHFNALIMSGEIKKMSREEYNELECSAFGTLC